MIYIFEPHPDDAFMSLHAHITTVWKDTEKTIVTLTGSEERILEAASYAKSVGCNHVFRYYEDGGWGKPKIDPISLWNLHIDPSEDQLVFPAGLRHPDHKFVASQAPKGSWFYLDAYYVQGESNEDLKALTGRTIVSMIWANENKRYYLSRFPSQAVRFMLAQPNYPPRFEVVMK